MRLCRIASHRLTACHIDGMPMLYPRLAVEAQQPLTPSWLDHLAVFACNEVE